MENNDRVLGTNLLADLKQMLMYRLNDNLLRLIGIPVCTLVNTFVTRNWEPGLSDIPLERQLFFTLLEVVVVWHACRVILSWSRLRFPGTERLAIRMIVAYVLYFFVALAGLVGLLGISQYSGLFVPSDMLSYGYKNLVISMGFITLSAAMYEAQYYFDQWLSTLHDNEQLKRNALRLQLDTLKMQIKPEFLFTGLDVISGQIRLRDRNTPALVDSMADMYRYILKSSEIALVPLSREIEFLQTYFQLLKARHGEAIGLRITVPLAFQARQLPPQTLQFLVEHILKSNRISKDNPLKINLFVENEKAIAMHLHFTGKKTGSEPNEKSQLVIPIEQFRFPGHTEPLVQSTGAGVKLVLVVQN